MTWSEAALLSGSSNCERCFRIDSSSATDLSLNSGSLLTLYPNLWCIRVPCLSLVSFTELDLTRNLAGDEATQHLFSHMPLLVVHYRSFSFLVPLPDLDAHWLRSLKTS